ncbi:hypothetical protein HMPREF1545_02939 [Oscillibacter sp. KLE 1728]|nr:hypothetical protein HMPREF1545_02939 [Oscillibacter sp. KLE 1728]ERK66467.1 hypothetical protein HMPREF1546_00806 [Oscillibacter sp. KLE 1745]
MMITQKIGVLYQFSPRNTRKITGIQRAFRRKQAERVLSHPLLIQLA